MIEAVDVPMDGLWHVGRAAPESRLRYFRPDPVEEADPGGGNRFDSYSGRFGTIYFGSDLEACYAEVLARFRPKAALALIVEEEWTANHMMGPGKIPADWRNSRIALRAVFIRPLPFVDLYHPESIAELNRRQILMAGLSALGIDEIDVSTLSGNDRRVTRFIAEHIYNQLDDTGNPLYGGIKYQSRLGSGYSCWGAFEGTQVSEIESKSIELNDPDMKLVANRYGLTVF
jgi:hypothetical protein